MSSRRRRRKSCEPGRAGASEPRDEPLRAAGRNSDGWLERLALLSVFALLALLALRQVGSLDVGFHLEAGEQILHGAGWPRTDSFTFTVGDHPYIDTSWGYQLLLAAIQAIAGAPGLVLFHAVLVLATFGFVYRTARLAPCPGGWLAPLFLLGALASELRFETRPELVSYTFLAGVLYLLGRHATGLRAPLWLLPPIFLVWANCHSLFILGWAALGCTWLGLLLERRRLDRPLALAAAASVAVTIVNPYGIDALIFPFTLATRLAGGNVFGESIGEFASPFALASSERFPFQPRLPIWAFRTLFVLVAASLVPLVRRRRFASALVALPFLYLSFEMVRNMPLLVIAGLPGLAWSMPGRRAAPSAASAWLGRAALVLLVGLAVTLGLRVYHDAYYVDTRRQDRFGLGWNRLSLPVDATAFAVATGLDGRVLNHLNYGGYLIWARPEPVFIDGRLEVIGERFYEQYRQALASPEALEACVARYGIRWMIFPYRIASGLLGRLSSDPRWRLVWVDHQAAIFSRAGEAARAHPDASLAPPLAALERLDTLPGLGGSRPGRARRWLAGLAWRQEFPEEAYGRGLFHYFRGDPAGAAAWFAAAIEQSSGAYYEIYNNLGSAFYRTGRRSDAARCYRVVLDDAPNNRLARERLAELTADP